MALILGIDAAWTETGSSGIALLATRNGVRTVLAANSSYAEFLGSTANGRQSARMPDAKLLLQRAENIAGATVDLVGIDMPIANKKINGRRVADNAISIAFGAQWASTHSPSETRPGAYGEYIANSFARAGYQLATDHLRVAEGRALVEVYPLVGLVRLMNATVRPAYKTAKISKYYGDSVPSLSKEQRMKRLLETWAEIITALGHEITNFHFDLPAFPLRTVAELKSFEDKLDAIISAWVGACVIEKRADPYGNDDSAIWAPIVSAPFREVTF